MFILVSLFLTTETGHFQTICQKYRKRFTYHGKMKRLLQLKYRYSPEVFHSFVTNLQNANEKWHSMDCSEERSSDGHHDVLVYDLFLKSVMNTSSLNSF